MRPIQQSDRLEGTTLSGKYSEVMALKGLSRRKSSSVEHGMESLILESQHNSAVSKNLYRLLAKSYFLLVSGSHKEWKFTAVVIYSPNSNGYGYGVSMITENGIRS